MIFQMRQGWGVVYSWLPSWGLFSTQYFCPANAPVPTAPFRIPSNWNVMADSASSQPSRKHSVHNPLLMFLDIREKIN